MRTLGITPACVEVRHFVSRRRGKQRRVEKARDCSVTWCGESEESRGGYRDPVLLSVSDLGGQRMGVVVVNSFHCCWYDVLSIVP